MSGGKQIIFFWHIAMFLTLPLCVREVLGLFRYKRTSNHKQFFFCYNISSPATVFR